MKLKASKEEGLLKDLKNQMKAVIEAQAVLRDGVVDARKLLKEITWKLEEIQATNEIVQVSLRRKINVEEMELLEKKVFDLEEKLATLSL